MALQEASEGNVYEKKVQGYEKQFKTPFFKGMKTLLFLGTSETNSKGMKNSCDSSDDGGRYIVKGHQRPHQSLESDGQGQTEKEPPGAA